jgi:putative endonuclease
VGAPVRVMEPDRGGARSIKEGGAPQAPRAPTYNPGVAEYFCYIIECTDGTFYTGWTTDPERRLRQHSAGRGARYTRAHPPIRLAFVEPQPDRAAAMRREHVLKALSRARKRALVDAQPPAEA